MYENMTGAQLTGEQFTYNEESLIIKTPTMNIFEEIEYKEFTEGKNIKAIAKKIKGAQGVAEKFSEVACRIGQLANEIDGDVAMLNRYADMKEIGELNQLVEILTTKLEVFEDKKVVAGVDGLASIFGIDNSVKKISKKEVASSLGL